jgi:hypothetical protein
MLAANSTAKAKMLFGLAFGATDSELVTTPTQ